MGPPTKLADFFSILLSERSVIEVQVDEAADAALLAAEQIDEAKPQPRASVRADNGAVDGNGKGRRRRLQFQRDRRAERKAATGPDKTASDREVRDCSVIGLLSFHRPFETKPCRATHGDSFVVPSLAFAVMAEPGAEAVPA